MLAVQTLDAALAAGNPTLVAQVLPAAWSAMAAAELEVPFAALFSPRLQEMPLTGQAGALAFRIGLLSSDYADVAAKRTPADATEAFLIGLATGAVAGKTAPDSLGRAIAPAFLEPAPEFGHTGADRGRAHRRGDPDLDRPDRGAAFAATCRA